MKSISFCLLLGAGLLLTGFSTTAQIAPPSTGSSVPAASRNSLERENRLNQQATDQARKLSRALHLNEAQYMQVRAFMYARLDASTEAEAQASTADERRAREEQAAATFQSRVVNLLTDDQLNTYFQLMARDARRAQAHEAAPPAADSARRTSNR